MSNPTIPYGYPRKCGDDEIKKHLDEYYESVVSTGGNINQLQVFYPLIQIGQSELQDRHTRKVTNLSVVASVLSLTIAISALIIAVSSSRSNDRWESGQLDTLERIISEIDISGQESRRIIQLELGLINSTLEREFSQ